VTENKANRLDKDIIQGKADVLRARQAVAGAAKTSPSADSSDKTEKVAVKPVRAVTVEPEKASHTDHTAGGEDSEPSSADIPHLNLGEKILVEQRQAASQRRIRSNPSGTRGGQYQAHDTVGNIIRRSRQSLGLSDADTPPAAGHQPIDRIPLAADTMNDSQRRLLSDIVSRDIAAFFE